MWADQLADERVAQVAHEKIVPVVLGQVRADSLGDKLLAEARVGAPAPDKERMERDVLARLVVGMALARNAESEKQAAGGALKAARLLPEEQARVTEWVRAALARAPQTREMIVEVKKRAAAPKAMTQVMISIGAIIGCFVAPIVGGHIGRRPAYFGLCLLSLVFTGYQFGFLHAYDAQFLILSGIVGCVTAAFYGWLPLYLPELFPTRVRATGQGLSFNFGRILAAAGAVQMGQLVGLLGGSYARAGATITLIYAVGLVLIWFAPETKGKPLPE
ncbi:MAG: MFS transporter [Planctomycetes bacterium]|nr:MFS transporter [Planctomycetota bacterium]